MYRSFDQATFVVNLIEFDDKINFKHVEQYQANVKRVKETHPTIFSN